MKTVVVTFFLSFSMLMGFAQEKTKKQIKEEQNLAKQKKIEALIETKNYEFVGDWAYPQGGRSVSLISNPNYFRIKNDSIYSEMPYFGRAYAGVAYGGGGLDFKGAMTNYSLKKNKNNFVIKTEVNAPSDHYSIILTIYFDGGASLSINSNNRASIEYKGNVEKYTTK